MPDDPLRHIEELRSQIRRLEGEKHSLDGQIKQAQVELADLYGRAGALMGLAPTAPVSLDDLEAFIAQTEADLREATAELEATLSALNSELSAHSLEATT